MQKQNEDRAIEDYAVIGDGRSAALISVDGSIDWLCWPSFDSPSLFGSLLGSENGGRWQVVPNGPFKVSRRYATDTNILETTFETPTGTIRLTDFMPVVTETFKRNHLAPDHELVRIVEGIEGDVEIAVRFDPRPAYGLVKPGIVNNGRLGLRLEVDSGSVGLHSRLDYLLCGEGATATATVRTGELLPFSLTYVRASPSVLPVLDELGDALERTSDWWQTWSRQCSYTGPYREAVPRSVLVLKLLHFEPSGAFVAAVSNSLPEALGGARNYDYRYCWLRDASLTIHVLCGTGYHLEAEAFVEWMLHATRLTHPKLMAMYDVFGNIARRESEVHHLSGYKNSRPVRIGNKAREQIQLDIYGEVICGVAKLHKNKGVLDREAARALIGFGRYVCEHWKDPDAGILEPRGELAIHTHFLLLCWVALHELIGLSEKGTLAKVPLEQFQTVRDEIRTFIERNSWDEKLQSYVSEPGTTKMDAILLLMALHNFHKASSARLRGTYHRVRSELSAGGPLLYRYPQKRGEKGKLGEGAFGICGFWAAELLAMGGGTLEEAEMTFQELLGGGNGIGLFAEEIEPETGAARGNFPQAFTHVGLISAAIAIERRREEQSKTHETDEAENVGACL